MNFFCEPCPLEGSQTNFTTSTATRWAVATLGASARPVSPSNSPSKRGRPPKSAYAVGGNPECGDLFRITLSEREFCCRACRWIVEKYGYRARVQLLCRPQARACQQRPLPPIFTAPGMRRVACKCANL